MARVWAVLLAATCAFPSLGVQDDTATVTTEEEFLGEGTGWRWLEKVGDTRRISEYLRWIPLGWRGWDLFRGHGWNTSVVFRRFV